MINSPWGVFRHVDDDWLDKGGISKSGAMVNVYYHYPIMSIKKNIALIEWDLFTLKICMKFRGDTGVILETPIWIFWP